MKEEISKFEPGLVKEVRKSGEIYVGRKHIGKVAHVYFERKED